MSAEDFLRGLYRTRKLTEAELAERLRALDALAAGKLRPLLNGEPAKGESVATTSNPLPRTGCPPLHSVAS